MRLFGWLKRKPKPLQPEAQWTVSIDTSEIRVCGVRGEGRSIAKTELTGIAIETNDSGPWGTDVWWLLFGADDKLACAFPQGATGEQLVIDYLMGLEGFDHSQVIKAMGSTDNAVFPLWAKGK